MCVARWNPRRWSLGASALVALIMAGCGSTGQPRASLHPSAEKRLLSLVARARLDASARDGSAVSAVLDEFVSEVTTLKRSGQLGNSTAAHLERAARATAAGAASRLHPRATHAAATAGSGRSGPQTATAADPATTTTAPASASTPSQISNPGAGPARQHTNPALPAGAKTEKQKACRSPWSGHHQHDGKRLGRGGFGSPKCQDGHYGWSGVGGGWHGGGGGD
jgi:hypothetical protein